MPIINTIKGDLNKCFESGMFDEIVHGCNCFHTMGAGIAGQIANKLPQALFSDRENTIYGDEAKLGTCSVASTKFGIITNAYTQFRPGREKKQNLYDNIKSCFIEINKECPDGKWLIGIPQIGAGIAGGNWEEIVDIINEVTPDCKIIVVEWVK